MNNNNKDFLDRKEITTLAFLIGIALTNNLNPTEQNAIGNFIMLIGQTLSTNASIAIQNGYSNSFNLNTLNKTSKIIQEEIDKINKKTS